MIQRAVTGQVLDGLQKSPVVLLSGARQTGKTTLAKSLLQKELKKASYVTFDHMNDLSVAKSDPVAFVSQFEETAVIDEVQRAPEVYLPIKAEVDERRRPGRFLLTGSADVTSLSELAGYLVGRVYRYTLWPLAQSEIEASSLNAVDLLFSDDPIARHTFMVDRADLNSRIIKGGYPQATLKEGTAEAREWLVEYLQAFLGREISELAKIEGIAALPNLLKLIAARTASTLNISGLSRGSTIPVTTLRRYFALLRAAYILTVLPAYSSNIDRQVVKAPKVIFSDTGLACAAVDSPISVKDAVSGQLFENFVIMELIKQASWCRHRVSFQHYRTVSGSEVDCVIERADGSVVGVEVKLTSTVNAKDVKGLKDLASALGEKMHRGAVFYTGDKLMPFGRDLWLVPVSLLWSNPF